VWIHRDVRELRDLSDAPVAYASPFCEARQFRFARDASAELALGFGEIDVVAALAKRARCFETGRAGTDDQDATVAHARGQTFRMPALAPLFAHRRILRATNRRARHVAGDADVAADTFADVIDTSFGDFVRQERIRDRRACRADKVEHAAFD